MKNYLAIDTSSGYLNIIAVKGGKKFSSFLPDCSMRHSVTLMPAVESLLKEADLRLEECDFFGAVVGAGSFTGIRIGISAVKGFALAYGKPTLPITSFEVAAYNAIDKGEEKILCLVDALHDAYYACGFEKGEKALPPAYLTEEEVLELAKQGYKVYACEELPIAQKIAVEYADPVEGLHSAAFRLSKEKKFGALDALYVRKSSAEINLCK